MGWVKDKVFNDVDDFILWLDKNFRNYIIKNISSNHVHHTYKPDHASNKKYGTLQLHKNMASFHVRSNGWSDIAQHLTIGVDGMCVTGRDIRKVPVSALNYNGTSSSHPFAYEMIGFFDKGHDKLEGKQLEASIKVSRYFYNLKKNIVFHRECLINGKSPKTCPGTSISKTEFMDEVKASATKTAVIGVSSDAPIWDDSMMRKGQIGRLRILKPINLWSRDRDNELDFVRILEPGSTFRVYGYDNLHGGQYNLGGGCWVTKMPDHIKYETPSQAVLEKAKKYYNK